MAFRIRENKKETENKTIRFPLQLINKIEEQLRGKNVTFSRFVIEACEYALDDMEPITTDEAEDNIKIHN